MKYEYGLVNYFLHELGINLENDDSAIINEEKEFDSNLSEEEKIIKEIDKIKNKSNKYNKYLDINNKNIKEIIICIDLLLGIEISFKTSFVVVAMELLNNEKIINIVDNDIDNYEDTIKESDKILINIIKDYLVKLCT